jgi:hypothetical protein
MTCSAVEGTKFRHVSLSDFNMKSWNVSQIGNFVIRYTSLRRCAFIEDTKPWSRDFRTQMLYEQSYKLFSVYFVKYTLPRNKCSNIICISPTFTCPIYWFYFFIVYITGARGSVVGCGTMLQAGRSRVRFPMRSLDFSIDLIFPAALLP